MSCSMKRKPGNGKSYQGAGREGGCQWSDRPYTWDLEDSRPPSRKPVACRPLPVFPECDARLGLEVTMILILNEHPPGAAIRLPGHELCGDRKQVGRIP